MRISDQDHVKPGETHVFKTYDTHDIVSSETHGFSAIMIKPLIYFKNMYFFQSSININMSDDRSD